MCLRRKTEENIEFSHSDEYPFEDRFPKLALEESSGKFGFALGTVEAVIAGVKTFILQKCTEGPFAKGNVPLSARKMTTPKLHKSVWYVTISSVLMDSGDM